MIIAWLLLAVGAVSTGLCFTHGLRTAGLVGVLAGLGTGSVLLVPGLAESRLLTIGAGFLYALGMVGFLMTRPSPGPSEGTSASGSPRLGRAVVGGLIGVVPGALVIAVPVVLHALGAISADASQIGFLGVFLVPMGLIAGALVGALTGRRGAPEDTGVGPRA